MLVDGLGRGDLAPTGESEEGAVFGAGGVDAGRVAVDVDDDVFGRDVASALGGIGVVPGGAGVDVEDVGGPVGDLPRVGDVPLHLRLFLVLPADQVVVEHRVHELGGSEDAAVRVPVIVRLDRRGAAHDAAVGGDARFGDGDRLLLLLLLIVGGDRLIFLLVGLLGLLLGGLLLRLLLGGLLLIGLLGLLLHRLLLLLLLLGDLRDAVVVVIVAAADQGETGRSDSGATRGAQQGAPAHSIAPHALPVVSLAHLRPP